MSWKLVFFLFSSDLLSFSSFLRLPLLPSDSSVSIPTVVVLCSVTVDYFVVVVLQWERCPPLYLKFFVVPIKHFRLCRSYRRKHFVPVYWSFAVSYADRHCPSTYHYLPCSSPVYPFVVEKTGAITSRLTQTKIICGWWVLKLKHQPPPHLAPAFPHTLQRQTWIPSM